MEPAVSNMTVVTSTPKRPTTPVFTGPFAARGRLVRLRHPSIPRPPEQLRRELQPLVALSAVHLSTGYRQIPSVGSPRARTPADRLATALNGGAVLIHPRQSAVFSAGQPARESTVPARPRSYC